MGVERHIVSVDFLEYFIVEQMGFFNNQIIVFHFNNLCVELQLKSMVPVGDKLLKAPRNAKELMATRLLEGHFVRCQCRGIQVCNPAPCFA